MRFNGSDTLRPRGTGARVVVEEKEKEEEECWCAQLGFVARALEQRCKRSQLLPWGNESYSRPPVGWSRVLGERFRLGSSSGESGSAPLRTAELWTATSFQRALTIRRRIKQISFLCVCLFWGVVVHAPRRCVCVYISE